VTAYILTPDPETIAAQIDTLSEAFARRSIELSSQAAHLAASATQVAIAKINEVNADAVELLYDH
jgi:hypothetical protein